MAKLKDGFYKLTASSIGSNLHVLLAGGGAKPISDFASSFNVKLWGLDFDGSKDVVGSIISDTTKSSYNVNHNVYYTGSAIYANDLSDGDEISISVGKSYSAKNVAYLSYHRGSTDDSSYLTMGLHSVDHVLNITPYGNVGIGTTEPAYKLDVDGSFHYTGGGLFTHYSNDIATFKSTNAIGVVTLASNGTYGTRLDIQNSEGTDVVAQIDYNGRIWGRYSELSGNSTASKFISTVTEGTAPLTVASTTKVNKLNADLLDGYHLTDIITHYSATASSGFDLNNLCSNITIIVASWDYAGSVSVSNSPWSSSAATTWTLPGSYPLQIARFYSSHDIRIRGYYSYTGWTAWKLLAFTDSDITGNSATATKLQTPRTIWGQSFDGTTNVSGLITIGLNLLTNPTILFFNGEFIDGYGNIKMSKDTNIWSVGHKDTVSSGVGLFVQALGNVGIGTNNPSEKLHIVGQALLSLSANGNLYYIAQGLTNGIRFGLGSGGINRGIYDNTNSNWMLYRDSTTNVLIPIGNVGIGTTAPQHKLSVFGQAYVSDNGPSIIINRIGTYKQEPCIAYHADGVQLGSIGIKDYNTPFFWNASTNNINTIWHSGNDGSESGLNADLLDGYHATNFLYRSLYGGDTDSYVFNNGATDVGWVYLGRFHGASGGIKIECDYTSHCAHDYGICSSHLIVGVRPYTLEGFISKVAATGGGLYIVQDNSSGYKYYYVYIYIKAWFQGQVRIQNLGRAFEWSNTVASPDSSYTCVLDTRNLDGYYTCHKGVITKIDNRDANTLDGLDSTNFMRAVSANGYYGLAEPGGGTSNWIRTTGSGIIPYQSGGHGSLGTSSWPFSTVYANNFYGYLNGNISGSAASARDMELITISKSLKLTTSWQDTGIYCSDIGTGSFVVRIEGLSDETVGGGHYSEAYTGLMSSFSGGSNSSYTDEIPLHRCGHAPNHGIIYLRTLRVSSNASSPKLLIAATYNATGAYTYTFKFRRII